MIIIFNTLTLNKLSDLDNTNDCLENKTIDWMVILINFNIYF